MKACFLHANLHFKKEGIFMNRLEAVRMIEDITKDGKFVMERQYRHGAGEVGYELPCGVMESGESPLCGAQRELLEETGYLDELKAEGTDVLARIEKNVTECLNSL